MCGEFGNLDMGDVGFEHCNSMRIETASEEGDEMQG
jgi:hypothetical protein